MTSAQDLHLHRFGAAPREALALHCTLAHGGAWRGLGDALQSELTLIAPDLPAHGRAGNPDASVDYQDACFNAVLPLLDTPKDIIGHSFGATVALRLAVEYPERVRSLCLIEPVLFAAVRRDDPDIFRAFQEQAAGFRAALDAGDLPTATRLFVETWGDGRDWADIPQRTRDYLTGLIRIIPAQDDALLHDRPGVLMPGRLERVTAPVLLMRGAYSPAVTGAIIRSLARRLPEARTVVIAGAGHMLPMTHPDETGRALVAFLRSS